MSCNSKIRLFSLFPVFVLLLLSCRNSKNDVIPDVYVNFTIDLLDPEFVNLNAIGGSDTINSRTNNWGSVAAGYDGNGIIVYCGPDGYYAYDRTCPHDFVTNNMSIKVNVDFVWAICPKCNTRYELANFGTPSSGTGRYPLKNYKTRFDFGRYITVWNY